jgi:hypothetical protein
MYGNDLFTSMSDRLKKKRLMEERIDKEAYDAGNTMLYNVHENQDTRFGSVNPHGDMGVKPVYEPAQANPRVPYGFSGSPLQGGGVVPKAVGIGPTSGTVGGSDAPKRDLDFTSYSKSLDKSFMMAALQSAIPEDQPAPSGISGGGAHGGGENLGSMQEYASAERRKKKNPALWRYSANV